MNAVMWMRHSPPPCWASASASANQDRVRESPAIGSHGARTLLRRRPRGFAVPGDHNLAWVGVELGRVVAVIAAMVTTAHTQGKCRFNMALVHHRHQSGQPDRPYSGS